MHDRVGNGSHLANCVGGRFAGQVVVEAPSQGRLLSLGAVLTQTICGVTEFLSSKISDTECRSK